MSAILRDASGRLNQLQSEPKMTPTRMNLGSINESQLPSTGILSTPETPTTGLHPVDAAFFTPPSRHRSLTTPANAPGSATSQRTGAGVPESLLNSAFIIDTPRRSLGGTATGVTMSAWAGDGQIGAGSQTATPNRQNDYIRKLEEENALMAEELQATVAELSEERELCFQLRSNRDEGEGRLQSILRCIYEQNSVLDQCCGQMDFLRALVDNNSDNKSTTADRRGTAPPPAIDAGLSNSTDEETEIDEKTPEEVSASCVRKLNRLEVLLKQKLKDDKQLRDQLRDARERVKASEVDKEVLRMKLESCERIAANQHAVAVTPTREQTQGICRLTEQYEVMLRTKEAEITRLRDDIARLNRNANIDEIHSLEAQLRTNKEAVGSLQNRVGALQAEKREIELARDSLQRQLTHVRKDLSTRIDWLTKDNNKLESERLILQTQYAELESTITAIKEATETKIKDMAIALVVAHDFQEEATSHKIKCENEKLEVAMKLETVENSAKRHLEQCQSAISNFEDERQLNCREIERLKQEIADLQLELDKLKSTNQNTKSDFRSPAESPMSPDVQNAPFPPNTKANKPRNSVQNLISVMEANVSSPTPCPSLQSPVVSRKSLHEVFQPDDSSPLPLPDETDTTSTTTAANPRGVNSRNARNARVKSDITNAGGASNGGGAGNRNAGRGTANKIPQSYGRSPLGKLKINDIVLTRSGPSKKFSAIVERFDSSVGANTAGVLSPVGGENAVSAIPGALTQDSNNNSACNSTPTSPKTTIVGTNDGNANSNANQAAFRKSSVGACNSLSTNNHELSQPAPPPGESEALKQLMKNGKHVSVRNALLEWCKERTKSYSNVDVTNFSSSWSDGLAFCALLHQAVPTKVPYQTLKPANKAMNFEIAKSAAESLGVTFDIDIDKIIKNERPDWKLILPYVRRIFDSLPES